MRICFTGMNMPENCLCVNNRGVREETNRICNYVKKFGRLLPQMNVEILKRDREHVCPMELSKRFN